MAIFGTCLSVFLWANSTNKTSKTIVYNNSESNPEQTQTSSPLQPESNINTVDTSTWKTYSNNDFSFKYNPEWKVLPETQKDGYTILQVDPGSKFYNIKIYISSSDFYVMSGLPSVTEKINNKEAINVSNLLYGIKHKDKYYTFDIGLSLSLKPLFNALVHSVEFK